MKLAMPTVDEVKQLTELIKLTVPEEWEDHNGHVNIQYYMTMYDKAGGPMMASIGITEHYFKERRSGFFDFEHHIRYLSEIHIGDTVSLYSRFIDMNEKRFHGMSFIVNESRQVLSSTMEFVSGGVDLEKRKTAPFPADIAKVMAQGLEKHTALTWKTPVCGMMSI